MLTSNLFDKLPPVLLDMSLSMSKISWCSLIDLVLKFLSDDFIDFRIASVVLRACYLSNLDVTFSGESVRF